MARQTMRLAGLGCLVGLMLWAVRAPGAPPGESEAQAHLKRLVVALLICAGDFDGKFPAGDGLAVFGMLLKDKYLASSAAFVHPASKRQQPAAALPLTGASCSYLYLGEGMKDGTSWDRFTPVVLEQPWLTAGGVHVAFVDGHVELLAGEFESASAIVEAVIARGKLPEALCATLRQKAQSLDARRVDLAY
jgi:prepilin-type processing-associated H-X9-DG protein